MTSGNTEMEERLIKPDQDVLSGMAIDVLYERLPARN